MTPSARLNGPRPEPVAGTPAGEGERRPQSPRRAVALGSVLLVGGAAANLLLLAAVGALTLAIAAWRHGGGRELRPLTLAFALVVCGVAGTLTLNGIGRAGTPWKLAQIEAALAVPVAVSAVVVAVATTFRGVRLLTAAPVPPSASAEEVWTELRAIPFASSVDVILSGDSRSARVWITVDPAVELVDVLAATRAALRARWVIRAELHVSWPDRYGSERLTW